MATEVWTQSDVDALKAAIIAGRGARSITFDNQTVTFNSIDDMLKLLAVMQQAVSAVTSGTPRTRYGVVDKGV